MNSSEQPMGKPAAAFVVETGNSRTGKPLYVIGDEVSVKISSHDTGGAFTVLENHTRPNAGPPLHRHFVQDEWWYILEGEYLFEVDGVGIHAGPGDTVFAPRGSAHTLQNVGTVQGRTLVTVVPGGLDLFFEELSRTFPPGTPPDPEILSPIFKKYGLELLGPPLPGRTSKSA